MPSTVDPGGDVPAINAVRDRAPDIGAEARVVPMWRGATAPAVSDDEIHRASLERALADVGLTVPDGGIRARLGAAGARVDDEDGRVRFPVGLLADAMTRAPEAFTLGGRDPDAALPVDGTRAWLSATVASRLVDLETGEERPSTDADLASMARVADATPQIGLVAAGADPLLASATLLAGTSKHVQIRVPAGHEDAHALVEIANAVAGSEGALRARPPLSVALRVEAPGILDGLDAAAILAGGGIPCLVEATGTGRDALAATVGAVACLQLLAPGASTLVGWATPIGARGRIAWVRVAEELGLRSQLAAFPTPAAGSDWRAGLDGGLAATAGWIAPPDLLSGAGLRAGGRVSSAAAMLLDAELFDLVRQIPLGFEVDEDALAVQVIADVGPAEHFLGEQHTLHHFRETWTSRFMDTSTWEGWEDAGRPEPPDHARDHAREIAASHVPAPLAPGVAARIEEVIGRHGHDR